MTKSVRKLKDSLDKKVERLQFEIKELQYECPHSKVETSNHSNVGNYDPSADIYWTVNKCLDCDLVWTTEQ